MRAPVASGLQSFAAANLSEGDPGDALICGGDDDAKTLSLELAGRVADRAIDVGPAGELARARGNDRGDPQREQALQGARRHPPHWTALTGELRIIPVVGLPEIQEGDDLAELITAIVALEDRDVVVIAQKAVSKSEGRVVRLEDIEPSERATEIAGDDDPRRIEVILREAARVVRVRPPLVISICSCPHLLIHRIAPASTPAR